MKNTLTAFLLFTLALASQGQITKPLSQYGTTNQLAPGDLIGVSVAPFSAKERPKGITATNLANSLGLLVGSGVTTSQASNIAANVVGASNVVGLTTVTNVARSVVLSSNAPIIARLTFMEALTNFVTDAFVFAGDSFIGEIGLNAGVAYGTAWPTLLMNNTNYSHYLYYQNFGVGGYKTVDVSNYYTTTISLWKPAAGTTAFLFLETGENEIDGSFTNFWTNLVIRARNDGFSPIVAFTTRTNGTSGVNQQLKNTNNLFLRASLLWDYLVDFDLLITNSAVQLAANGHPTPTLNQNTANYIGANIIPPHSSRFRNIDASRTLAPDFITVRSNLNMLGGLNILGPVIFSGGIGGQLGWDGSEVVLTSTSDGLTTYAPVYIQASDLHLNKGGIVIDGPSGKGVSMLTNVFAAPTPGVGGVVWANSNGSPWVFWNTNGVVLSKCLVP